MKIETKFSPGDEVFIIINSVIHEVEIETMKITVGYWANNVLIAGSNVDTEYEIKQHPNGGSYSTTFNESKMFATKQDLLDSL